MNANPTVTVPSTLSGEFGTGEIQPFNIEVPVANTNAANVSIPVQLPRNQSFAVGTVALIRYGATGVTTTQPTIEVVEKDAGGTVVNNVLLPIEPPTDADFWLPEAQPDKVCVGGNRLHINLTGGVGPVVRGLVMLSGWVW